MKTRTAAAIAAVAIALGAATGLTLLPRHDDSSAADPAASAGSTATPPGSPAANPPAGRLGVGDLLTGADLTAAGYRGTVSASSGSGEGGVISSECTPGAFLSDRAPLGSPLVHGVWRHAEKTVAREVAVQVADERQSARLAERVLAESEDCQDEPPAHWRYDATRHAALGDGVTADSMSLRNGTNSGSGVGPPCGGLAVIRNRARFGVVYVDWCAGPTQLQKTAAVAARRLGGR